MDTATPAVTVALHDGTSVVAETGQVDARRHGELLLPAVDRVLAEAGVKLDAVTDVAVGVGPGPYTGLRVGLVTAATFGSALSVPVHGVCTLDALAYAHAAWTVSKAPSPSRPTRAARRSTGRGTRTSAPGTATPPSTGPPTSRTGSPDSPWPVPALLYPEAFPDARGPEHVSAAALAAFAAGRLAAGAALLPPQPLYLRRPDAQVPKNYKVVTPK